MLTQAMKPDPAAIRALPQDKPPSAAQVATDALATRGWFPSAGSVPYDVAHSLIAAATPQPAAPSQGLVERCEEIDALLREHIKVDATGLSPSIAGMYIIGIAEAARAIDAAIPAGEVRDREGVIEECASVCDRYAEHELKMASECPSEAHRRLAERDAAKVLAIRLRERKTLSTPAASVP